MKDDIDDLQNSSIYIVNTHRDLDYMAFWGLGYAMGKGMPIIGYNDGKREILIPSELVELITMSSDAKQFVELISRVFGKLTPQTVMMKDWSTDFDSFKTKHSEI